MARLEEETSDPNLWNNAQRASEMLREVEQLRDQFQPWKDLRQQVADLQELYELAREEEAEEIEGEIAAGVQQAEKDLERIETSALLSGEYDGSGAIVTISPGAGGTESQDWAEILLRMYLRWVEERGLDVEMVSVQAGEGAGIKDATFIARGPLAYGYLKTEKGVHRLVRISPFDANNRRHTSFSAVDVIPELNDEVKIEVAEDDLKVETFRSSGAGGQHVNKTESAVRMTHLPTGIVASCQNERSQHKNRATAMKILQARLFEQEQERQREKLEQLRGELGSIAWGNQIRSYVLHPYQMVKDHRTSVETSDAQRVLDGDLDRFMEAALRLFVPKPGKDNGPSD